MNCQDNMVADFDLIISRLKKYIGKERLLHTIGVYKCAEMLGKVLLPHRVDELCVAALLHDIAKELDREEMMKLISYANVELSEEDINTVSALHSFAGAELAKSDFRDLITEDIYSAIFNHTLGQVGMSLFDKIIFIADYIEDGRVNDSAKEVRAFLRGAISDDVQRNICALDRAIVMSIDNTSVYVLSNGGRVNSRSLLLRESLINSI